jgi:hypothetical protein
MDKDGFAGKFLNIVAIGMGGGRNDCSEEGSLI